MLSPLLRDAGSKTVASTCRGVHALAVFFLACFVAIMVMFHLLLPTARRAVEFPSKIAVAENEVFSPFGVIVGQTLQKTRQFLGIPYAKPPVGQLRWAPTQPWEDSFDGGRLEAIKYSPLCPQSVAPEMDEDCLTLNVFTRRTQGVDSAPVFFWVHGGGFMSGGSHYRASDVQDYNGTFLADKHGLVVVTVNYRLGVLGWLSLPGALGNFGMWDQITALRWVRDHIALFGGNPNHVHLAGQSAGAISVCSIMVARPAWGLFHSASMESGHCEARPLEANIQRGRHFAKGLGCEQDEAHELLACARSVPWQKLREVQKKRADKMIGFYAYPVIDDVLVTEQPLRLIKSGQVPPVPFFSGQNVNAGTWFAKKYVGGPLNEPKYMSKEYFEAEVFKYLQQDKDIYPCFHDVHQEVFKFYQPSENSDNSALFARFMGDVRYVCTNHLMVQWASEQGLPVSCYSFRHRCLPGLFPEVWGSYHGAELHYVFGEYSPNCSHDQVETEMVDAISSIWATFAKDHTWPESLPTWPTYNASGSTVMVLEHDNFHTTGEYRKQTCAFWHKVYCCNKTDLCTPMPK